LHCASGTCFPQGVSQAPTTFRLCGLDLSSFPAGVKCLPLHYTLVFTMIVTKVTKFKSIKEPKSFFLFWIPHKFYLVRSFPLAKIRSANSIFKSRRYLSSLYSLLRSINVTTVPLLPIRPVRPARCK